MAQTAARPGAVPAANRPALMTQQIAWAVILIAFGIFCVLCVLLGLGVNYVVYQSVVPMPAVLVVGRGTVGLTGPDQIEQVVRGQREVLNSAVFSTDNQSQATLSFLDQMQSGRLVAAITVKRDTTFDLENVSRPRFEVSSLSYDILLQDVSGALDVFIPTGLSRSIRLSLRSVSGAWVVITGAGQYSVRANPADIVVDNQDGEVVLIAPDARVLAIPPGQRGIWSAETDAVVVATTYTNLLVNSSFEQTNLTAEMVSPPTRELPLMWGCADQPNDAPSGDYRIEWLNGRAAMHLYRGGGASSHGETFCVQSFGPPGTPGRDLSEFDYLSLRATFMIRGQSLSACGVAGSECPMMFRITYVDAFGREQNWYRGFYAYADPAFEYPTTCDSCRQEHDVIHMNTWYTYESENLFNSFSPLERPQSIREVRFYASGHEYDVYVSRVSLLAGRTELPTPAEALGG